MNRCADCPSQILGADGADGHCAWKFEVPIGHRRRHMTYQTYFGSLDQFEKGTIELTNDKATNYAFSNIFEVASRSRPYEKVVVGKNLQYVIETLRAEGESSWFAASHDEFAIVMDGEVEVNFIKLDNPATIVPPAKEGSVRIEGKPVGKKMGLVRLKRGHQALLPAGAAYQFRAVQRGVLVLQTILGDHSVERWKEICYQ